MFPLLIHAAGQASTALDTSNVVSFLSGLTALVAIAITSLRKRKDVTIEELQARDRARDAEIEELKLDRDAARADAVMNGRDLFTVRQILAAHGIPDTTVSPSRSDQT